MLHHIWVRIDGSVPVGVGPDRMVYGVVSVYPALQWGVEPTCCISYGLYGHTHIHGGCLPVGII